MYVEYLQKYIYLFIICTGCSKKSFKNIIADFNPPAWGLGEGLTVSHRKSHLVTKYSTPGLGNGGLL
jgi:hypothetical protein